MRLKRLNVAGFGKLGSKLELSFAPGFNLLLAPNEAGKTTTLELITALLYGFGRRVGGAHPFEPWGGDYSEVGGELGYELADGREFALSRHLLKRGERQRLRDASGAEMDLKGAEPGQYHLGLSKGVFQTVSRVQLDDLQKAFSGASGREYQDARQELLGYFFAEAATRGQVRNPVEVREAWENSAAALYHSHGNRGRADKELISRLEMAEAELAQARQREANARQAQADLELLAAETTQVNQRLKTAARELERAQAALARAQEAARKAALQAEVAGLVAAGLSDEASERRARDLEREAAAAEERARQAKSQALEERGKAGGGDPSQELARLSALESSLTALGAREREAAAQGEDLGRRLVRLQQDWQMDPDALAGLGQDLPFKLHELKEWAQRAQEDAERADREREALPQPPRWALGLGFGAVAVVVGIKGLIWSFIASWPWWAWALTGLLSIAGLGLGVSALLRRGRARSIASQAERLADEAEEAAVRAAKWQAELASVSAGIGPKGLAAEPGRLAAAMAEAVSLKEQAAKQAEALSRLSAERVELAQGLAELAGESAPGDWHKALEAAKQACQVRGQALRDAERLERQAGQEQALAEAGRKDLSRLLADAGLADLQALQKARERARRVDQLSAKLAEVDERLAKMPQGDGSPHDQSACQNALQAAQEQVRDLQAKLGELGQHRGRLEQELKQLNQAQSAAQAEAVLEDLRLQRRDLASRHGVLLLAGACLERAMQRFRLEAQPSLLQKAGEFMSRSSAGAYAWLGSNIFEQKPGQDPDLTARSGPGAMDRQAQALSRGTRDQLYLSLRLALAQEITDGGEPVPLLLDDPLVNFDDERLAATLAMLMELSHQRQVLLLTCHRGQYELAEGMGPCNLLTLI